VAEDIYMPQLGLTMTEGKVVRWLKAAGDPVRKGEPVLAIETDKVSVEVESPADGVLGPILVEAGATVPIGGMLSHVLPPTSSTQGEKRKTQEETPVRASPLARRLAQELGVDLTLVEGTGPGGRIVEDDVRRAAAATRRPESALPAPQIRNLQSQIENPIEPLSGIRRVVAERMAHSFATAPHFYLSTEVEATALTRMREGLLAKVEAATSARLTVTDILLKVCAQALAEFPDVNVAWAEDAAGGIVRHTEVNVGLAVSLDTGLVVPVLHGTDRLTLGEIARRRSDLVERARGGKLTLADLEGGTFTLSNLGMFGVDQFHAILNPPQSAILAVGRIKDRPVAAAGAVVVRPTMHLTLSVDHRVLDGALGARFLERVAQLIQEPYLLLT
jgi:pyruvate dehydrogenase E2 component (dihydrolipoamide acetyltransferase)